MYINITYFIKQYCNLICFSQLIAIMIVETAVCYTVLCNRLIVLFLMNSFAGEDANLIALVVPLILHVWKDIVSSHVSCSDCYFSTEVFYFLWTAFDLVWVILSSEVQDNCNIKSLINLNKWIYLFFYLPIVRDLII